jgi:ubiquinone/menaquinone biosynthesis C-methylase UbiE
MKTGEKVLVDHWSQYQRPSGAEGRFVAEKMNKVHFELTSWGLKHVKIEPTFVILDVGCGGGRTLSRLTRRARLGKVYGIDYSRDMAAYSMLTNCTLVTKDRISVVAASVSKTSFRAETFDLVTAVETYYFWPNLTESFKEIWRILKLNARFLLINEMVKDGVFEVKNADTIQKTQVKLYSLKEIQAILWSCGFGNVEVFRKRKSYWNVILAQKTNSGN